MATSRMADQIGRVLGGRYRLTAPIGTGASAQVFLADDVVLRRRVAVKVLHPALADDDGFLRRFRAEARAAAALSHPNVMAVYDWDDDGGPYLILEYLGGGSLRTMLDQGHRLSLSQALAVGLDAARGLDFAHRRGFVHRDVKPANLLFDEEGRLRIADFGVARALAEAAWTEPGSVVGTARYAAPEQARGENVDGRADVYSLALVLIEAVTGVVPFVADTPIGTLMARLDAPIEVPEAMGPLRPALQRAGQIDPAERSDAGDLGRRLLAAARRLDAPKPLPLVGAIDLAGAERTATADPTLLPTDARLVVHDDGDITVLDDGGDADAAAEPLRRRLRRRVRRPWSARRAGGGHRRRWPWVLPAVVLVAAIGAGGAYAWTTLLVSRAGVPEVLDLTREDALARIEDTELEEELDWNVRFEERHFDNIAAGLVADQDPDGGEELKDGGTVLLVVSQGPPPRDVPADLGETPEADARARIADAELEVGAVTQQFDENVPPGHVITWFGGGVERPETLPKGSPVDLVVSGGPEPRTIPSVVGAPVEEAQAELESMGLFVQVAEPEFHPTIPAGRVIRSNPGEGATIERGGRVGLAVSKGPDLVRVPDVRNRGADEAAALLRDAGFTPGEVFGRAGGKVFTTDPEIGSTHPRGTRVDIFLK